MSPFLQLTSAKKNKQKKKTYTFVSFMITFSILGYEFIVSKCQDIKTVNNIIYLVAVHMNH